MSLREAILYALTLPERTVRSAAAAIGGTSKLLTDTLLPRSLRGTTIYRVMLGSTQRFLIESLGEVKTGAAAEKLPEDFVARKIAGNVADAAGIFAFHFSPLWFFAIVADGASGTKVYLQRVVDELKKDGSLAKDATIGSAEDLLDALTGAATKSSMPFDTPPLTRADLTTLKDDLAHGYGAVLDRSLSSLPTVDGLWSALMELRKREPVSLVTLSGAMALSGAKAAGKAGGALFYERVIGSYGASIDEVGREGFTAFWKRETGPYLEAIAGAFAPGKKTFTAKLLGYFGGSSR